jgi:hypothetical protein
MYAVFDKFELRMTLKQAESASHQGDCADDVMALLELPNIARQLNKIPPDDIRDEPKSWGAWEDDELEDQQANRERIVWIAARNIVEERREATAYKTKGM